MAKMTNKVEETNEVELIEKPAKVKKPKVKTYKYNTGDNLDEISKELTGKNYMIYRILQYSGKTMNDLKDGDVLKWGE